MKLSDQLFSQLRDFIYEHSGLFFADHKKYLLESRISRRIARLKLKDFEEYHRYLRNDSFRKEMKSLFNEITINETYFFRNEPQLNAFRDVVLPKVLSEKMKNRDNNLRIWSAGCSSGEEPYTLAILLKEKLGLAFSKWNTVILATDISDAVLEVAKKGIFGSYSLRNVPKNLVLKYFSKNSKGFQIKDEHRENIQFINKNVRESLGYPYSRNIDIVFCRNVLIYFDMKMKKQVVNSFYDHLKHNGYLFIGHSESLHGISKSFKLIHFSKAMAYLKE